MAWLTLLFPHATSAERVDREEFERYCLEPAMAIRGAIRQELHRMDAE